MAAIKSSNYKSRSVDKFGNAEYTKEENSVWHDLYERQVPIVKTRACPEYFNGVQLLDLNSQNIPQCTEVSKVLLDATGWQLEPVPALIPFNKFFELLASRRFPAATFIRSREDMDYLKEPDIFHEVFGHCPLLTNQAYADFTQTYGKLCLTTTPEDRAMLAKLYWFTIEFGLVKSEAGPKVYGGGILSSKEETIYAVDSEIPQRKPFDVIDILRTPYRIDILQPVYFVIDNLDVLFSLVDMDLLGAIKEARALGMYEPLYDKEKSKE